MEALNKCISDGPSNQALHVYIKEQVSNCIQNNASFLNG